MNKWILIMITGLLSASVKAEEVDYNTLMDSITEPLQAVRTKGQVQSIDLATRTGMVSGFAYMFGPHTEPLVVKMLGSSAGALELITPGMYVEILYINPQGHRIALEVLQIPEDESLLN